MSFRGITSLTNDTPVTMNAQQTEQGSGVADTANANLGATALSLIGHVDLSPAEENAIDDRLRKACKQGDVPRVQDLLDQGAQVNSADLLGYTPLHEAVFGNNAEV